MKKQTGKEEIIGSMTRERIRLVKDSVARDKGYSDWERMENWIMDHNDSGNTAVMLVSAMEDVIDKLSPVQSSGKRLTDEMIEEQFPTDLKILAKKLKIPEDLMSYELGNVLRVLIESNCNKEIGAKFARDFYETK
jgi:hypothetical protein